MNRLIVVLGPTASGKTELSIKLAKKYNGEVVSADSRQIYRGMDIGTAKPTKKEMGTIPHWILDIKNPNEPYTVAEFKNDAIKIIRDIQKRNKLPILVGGTGLYIKAVVENLDIPRIGANPLLRQKIEKEAKKNGLDFVFQKLIKLDPEAAYIIDSKNPRRVIRALEITLLTKKPFSQQRRSGKPLFDVLKIGVSTAKERLKEKIYLRVDKMIKEGLVKEVEYLVNKYGADQQAFDAIGYREIIKYINNKKPLGQVIAEMKINTWHYAKRQTTWFKKDKRINWVRNYKETERVIDKFIMK
ncbi:MAG: tRNA (adenosine(37)-N6)-dimethylallyltransferase MiaA [Candidatus Staskawiczbacteria bacterium RIFCSPLOWO2_12_FULL_37_15]|uniref:tRNA dimethylallyltransferase n=1 Tax=Candidatus Staskawiczbacteria bacterium RIFCSPLOWO2_12_FULL_37_15 TaxID=1802218 RepID=A0A1G2IMW2_9BACT|nr:MAG: tRNA dimethylallyltransferase [Parcubacteria group bacterium GW2011_GWA2_37_10]OGZ75887.1 MAG: tRNA (adenosine(37)-N6)-dimethylallyltransferase MiaA [Candidatus Staskawiczbacteria bacterium RIFCSPLOWO2_12_FULL_37_15]